MYVDWCLQYLSPRDDFRHPRSPSFWIKISRCPRRYKSRACTIELMRKCLSTNRFHEPSTSPIVLSLLYPLISFSHMPLFATGCTSVRVETTISFLWHSRKHYFSIMLQRCHFSCFQSQCEPWTSLWDPGSTEPLSNEKLFLFFSCNTSFNMCTLWLLFLEQFLVDGNQISTSD